MNQKQKVINNFESMKDLAELKAISNISLNNPLTDKQFKRMMYLKEKCLN